MSETTLGRWTLRRRALRWLAPGLLTLAVWVPGGANAQSLSMGRRLGNPAPDGRVDTARDEPAAAASEGAWPGPRVGLDYTYLRLADGWGGGDTHAAGIAAFLQWPVSELRTGLRFEMGGRDNTRSSADIYARGALEVGVQLTGLLDPIVPHLSGVLTVGGIVGERFETTVAHAFAGGGVELGVTLRLVETLHVDATFGYLRLEMNGAAYDAFLFRAQLGL